jgi:hypothetical protein
MVDKSKFVNHFEIDDSTQESIEEGWGPMPGVSYHAIPGTPHTIEVINELITPEITAALRRQLDKHKWLAVGLDGKADHTYNEIGNYRLSNWNPGLARRLWERLQGFYADRTLCDAFSPTDHNGHPVWRPVGVSPLFRYIRYAEGGKLVAHYDETFVQSDTLRTLDTMVIYLTDNEHGATRFINDEQVGRPIADYDFRDWDRSGNEDEVALRIPPRDGNALIFPHRMLHDSEPLQAGDPEKIIIRTDILFEKVL